MHRLQYDYAFPPKLGALGTRETLKGPIEVAMENPDMLKIRAWLQQRDISPKKGSVFIVGNGCIYVLLIVMSTLTMCTKWIWKYKASQMELRG
jgi:hypothetical protein